MDQKKQSDTVRTDTYLIRVNRNENEPWRGNVIWVSQRAQQNFFSIRELLELLNNAQA